MVSFLNVKSTFMTRVCFITLMLTLLLAACTSEQTHHNNIVGTYSRIAASDINTVYDTIIFSPVNNQAKNVYRIDNRSKVVFKNEKEQSYNKKTTRTYTGTYDSENQIMHTEDPGRIYSFDFEDSTVRINAVLYRKIQ